MELDFNSKFAECESYENFYLELMDVTFKKLSIKCDPIVSVSIVDNRYIHKINKKYRGIDRPTDVISFAFLDSENNYDKILFSPGPVVLGDIYISLDKAKEQAVEYGHSLHRELSFLFVHGLLHLLGYDHMNKEDEEEMFKLQDEILSEKGV
ncbi:MAG: rRNA maturation RNase YbeY [Bacilli bacterium]|nr:rRNA maturation RNase YbeY [Bacilli bacterium]